MKKHLYFFQLSLFIISCASQKSDTAQIKECFDNCKSAIIEKDGENAIKYVSEKSFAEYSILLQKIKQEDSLELSNEEYATKLFILRVRHLIPPEQILRLNSRSLLVVIINYGISNNNNIRNSTLKEITIKDNSANATLMINGKLTPFVYSFSKENNMWKIILRVPWNLSFKQLFPDAEITETEYIENQLLEISNS